MNKLTVPSSIVSYIRDIKYYTEIQNTMPDFILNKEVQIDEGTPKELFIETISESISYTIEFEYVSCKIKRTEGEIERCKKELQDKVLYNINRVKDLYNSNECYKIQIENYLILNDLQYILDKL